MKINQLTGALCLMTALVSLPGCKKPVEYQTTASQQANASVTSDPAPQLPRHLYAIKDGFEYGYEQALSEQDQKQGRATNALLMVSYLGKKGAAYQVMLKENEVRTVAECTLPCEYAKVYTFMGDRFIKKETMPVNPATLLAGIFADAIKGNLDQIQGFQNGTATTFWVDGDKKRLIVGDAKISGITR